MDKMQKTDKDMLQKVVGGNIAGGPLTESDKDWLLSCIRNAKASGQSLEVLVANLSKAGYSSESISFVRNNW